MPRKTKEEEKETKTAKKVATKKTTSKTKKVTEKTSSVKAKKTTKAPTKQTKATSKKSKKDSTKRKSTKSQTTTQKTQNVEYYDLPYRYNQTIVKILAQTPTNLFIYWDISDEDRENYKKEYGENFFEITKPILKVYNDTLKYSFEVEINDFANSWYLNVADSKCDYRIELGRKPINQNDKINTNYIYVASSNKIESPNDHILFDKNQKMVYFRNVKTGEQTNKYINTISFIRNMGKIYNIYDLYKKIYKDENIEDIYDLSNPSSSNPSS